MKSIYAAFIILLFVGTTVFLTSCTNTQNDEEAKSTANVVTWDTDPAFYTDSMIETPCKYIPATFTDDDAQTMITFPAYILMPYEYHGDEVTADMQKADWHTLYKNGNEYQLDKAKLKFTHFHDPIVDESESEKTGVAVTGSHENEILLANTGELTTGILKHVDLDTNVILPGKSYYFDFGDAHYRLYASAYRYKEQMEGQYTTRNYKLYLERQQNGQTTKQLLIARPFLPDLYDMPTFLFVGDIDNDNQPDIIFNVLMHNSSDLILYLSGNADQGKLLKVMAMHESSGC